MIFMRAVCGVKIMGQRQLDAQFIRLKPGIRYHRPPVSQQSTEIDALQRIRILTFCRSVKRFKTLVASINCTFSVSSNN